MLISCFGTRAAQWIANKWWEVPPPQSRAKDAAGGAQSYIALTDRKVDGSEVVPSLVQAYRDQKDGFLWLRWLFVSEETQKTMCLLVGEDSNPATRCFTLRKEKKRNPLGRFRAIAQTMTSADVKVLCDDAIKFLKEFLKNAELKIDTKRIIIAQLFELSTELALQRQRIVDEGTEVLGAALQVNRTLQSLYLGNTQIGATGAQALGETLQVNQALQSLSLVLLQMKCYKCWIALSYFFTKKRKYHEKRNPTKKATIQRSRKSKNTSTPLIGEESNLGVVRRA